MLARRSEQLSVITWADIGDQPRKSFMASSCCVRLILPISILSFPVQVTSDSIGCVLISVVHLTCVTLALDNNHKRLTRRLVLSDFITFIPVNPGACS